MTIISKNIIHDSMKKKMRNQNNDVQAKIMAIFVTVFSEKVQKNIELKTQVR